MQCRVAKFNGVHTLTLHIPENFGADHTTLTFIGIKGDLTEVRLPLCPLQELSLEGRKHPCCVEPSVQEAVSWSLSVRDGMH